MRLHFILVLFIFTILSCKTSQDEKSTLQVSGLLEAVEVIRDKYGINHIYAQNQNDLFFAQGYCAAKDRLFQFEIWRRQATGTVAEILGERELKRDIGTRLFKYRGDLDTEFKYYHQDGVEIINAYTDGVNAYIEKVLSNPELLPVTMEALDIKPDYWTPDVVISRHQGLLGNIGLELKTGIAVAAMGVEKVQEYAWFHPKTPKLELDPAIDGSLLNEDILELYDAYRKSVKFEPHDVIPAYRGAVDPNKDVGFQKELSEEEQLWIGSNNWVTRPELSENGHAYMANDPHRRLAVPSLRYWAHLVAPGWNVIGGGEPEIPGISIGHNEYGAWGLTVYRTDGEDLYVYELNPDNLNQYKYQDDWVDMTLIQETINVKESDDVTVDLRYTRHGPVTYIDSVNYKAYAVRCAWLEPGGSPYLASLRMDQAKNWEEFRAACNYSHIPGENMIWADKEGNIGWQAVGIAPLRRNFSGMVPVPGDGRYEWDGYLPIIEKPSSYNPKEGYIATANQNVTPDHIPQEWDAVGFSWSDYYRGSRLNSVLGSGNKITMENMQKLQTDYFSIPATILVPFIQNMDFEDNLFHIARMKLTQWDFILDHSSESAGIYIAWENELRNNFFKYFPDPTAEAVMDPPQLSKLIQNWIQNPKVKFGSKGQQVIERYLKESFVNAVLSLQEKFGSDMNQWLYGGAEYKHVSIKHPLSNAVNTDMRYQLNTSLKPRGGNQYTTGATGSGLSQTHGASFRIIVDVNDWDASVGMNAPGQSGDPESPYYKNLYNMWAEDEFFPVYYSKEKVKNAADQITILSPN